MRTDHELALFGLVVCSFPATFETMRDVWQSMFGQVIKRFSQKVREDRKEGVNADSGIMILTGKNRRNRL